MRRQRPFTLNAPFLYLCFLTSLTSGLPSSPTHWTWPQRPTSFLMFEFDCYIMMNMSTPGFGKKHYRDRPSDQNSASFLLHLQNHLCHFQRLEGSHCSLAKVPASCDLPSPSHYPGYHPHHCWLLSVLPNLSHVLPCKPRGGNFHGRFRTLSGQDDTFQGLVICPTCLDTIPTGKRAFFKSRWWHK